SEFLLHGLPSDFAEKLKSAAEELREAIESQVDVRGRRKGSIQEFEEALNEGLGYLQRFEALLMNTMSDNASVIASWEVAGRKERARSTNKAGPTPAPAPPDPPKPEVVSTA